MEIRPAQFALVISAVNANGSMFNVAIGVFKTYAEWEQARDRGLVLGTLHVNFEGATKYQWFYDENTETNYLIQNVRCNMLRPEMKLTWDIHPER